MEAGLELWMMKPLKVVLLKTGGNMFSLRTLIRTDATLYFRWSFTWHTCRDRGLQGQVDQIFVPGSSGSGAEPKSQQLKRIQTNKVVVFSQTGNRKQCCYHDDECEICRQLSSVHRSG